MRHRSILTAPLMTAAVTAAMCMAWTGPALAMGLIRDAEIESTLRKLATPIFRAAAMRPDAVELLLIQDDQPNAFVFDGRHMAITTGLIQDMEGPAELQGVMAHETGHITGGHLARRGEAVRTLSGPALIAGLIAAAGAAAAGSGGGALGALAGSQSVAQRALLAYNRSEEAAADQAAMTYLEQAGINPGGLRKVMDRFRGQEVFLDVNRDPYALTHPLSASRIALVERRSAESAYAGAEPSADHAYWFARMKAKLDGFIDHPRSVLRDTEGATGEFDLIRRAVAFHRLPDPAESLALVDRLIELRPEDPYYHELKGQFLLENGEGPAAAPAYARAVELAPDQPLLRAQYGRALLTTDDPDAAARAVEMLEQGNLASETADPAVLRDLAFAYARAGREGEAALATAERLALVGAVHDARLQAERAKRLLPENSAKWLRADDIVASLRPLEGEGR